MLEWFSQPWPWYIAGPLIALVMPALLLFEGKQFGLSENLRHICAACVPGSNSFLNYDWKTQGLWNMTFVLGIFIGGIIAGTFMAGAPPQIAASTIADLEKLGFAAPTGYVPTELFSWSRLTTVEGFIALIMGGFLVGFGTRWAGGCTSGHAISGLSNLQFPSLLAVLGFFAGGLLMTHFLMPFLFG